MRGHQGRTPVEHLGISPLRLAKVRAPASRPGWWPGVLTGTPRTGPAGACARVAGALHLARG
ncbi:hypothetical protein ACFPN0_05075 [Kitasatospora cinereorecta]